ARDMAGMAGFRFLYHTDGGTDLPWRAIAALEPIVTQERILHRVQRIAVCQTLGGGNHRAIVGHRKSEAGGRSSSIEQDGAGAALAMVTALLRRHHTKLVAQRVQQSRSRIDGQRALHSVNPECDPSTHGVAPV